MMWIEREGRDFLICTVIFFFSFVLSLLFHLSFNKMSLPPPWYLSACKDLCIYLFRVVLFLVHICSCFDLNSLSSGASFFCVSLLPDLLTAVRSLLSSRSIIFLLVVNAWTPSLDMLPARRKRRSSSPGSPCSAVPPPAPNSLLPNTASVRELQRL